MSKKFRPKKERLSKSKSRKAFYVAITLTFLIVIGVTTLAVCWKYYQWEWSAVAYWLNPFSEGNHYTWMVYAGLVIAIMLIIWLLHKDGEHKSGV